jgi:lysophospholipase L1-like esterase
MRKLLLVLVTLLALVKAPDFLPAYRDYRVVDFSTLVRIFDFAPRKEAFAELQWNGREDVELAAGKGVHPLATPDKSLEAFFGALRRAEAKQDNGVVRIVHYGDSPTTADLITADIRQMLQTQFGDAGHGYHLIAKPWAWYEHRGVSVDADGWTVEPANQSELQDGIFGLGGVTFLGPPGAMARFKITAEEQIEVHAWRRPGGGRLSVYSGGMRLGEIDTQAAQSQEAFATFSLPANAKQVELRVSSGMVRLFGVEFGKSQPGIIYSSLGVNGAHVGMLATRFREDHWTRSLQHVKPDLVVLNYGTNESTSMEFVDSSYEKTLRTAIARVRKALPKSSLLIMSPMDRGQREMSGTIGTVPALRKVVAIQAKVAADTKVAFFNTFEAMGGEGTMGRWYLAEPRMVGADLIHPMPSGAKLVGNLFFKAVLDSYNRYKVKTLRQQFSNKSATIKASGAGTTSPVPLPRAQ